MATRKQQIPPRLKPVRNDKGLGPTQIINARPSERGIYPEVNRVFTHNGAFIQYRAFARRYVATGAGTAADGWIAARPFSIF
jgi:hypothetical protein